MSYIKFVLNLNPIYIFSGFINLDIIVTFKLLLSSMSKMRKETPNIFATHEKDDSSDSVVVAILVYESDLF